MEHEIKTKQDKEENNNNNNEKKCTSDQNMLTTHYKTGFVHY